MNPELKRNSLHPANSTGRSHGSIVRTSSHESLTAHPLLSPTLPGSSSSSVASSSTAGVDSHSTQLAATRYVPYTPRQRAPATSTATGLTIQSTVQASPQPLTSQGDATSKLQLMNLKAAAQKGGLDSASTGWAVLEKLGTETDHGTEWNKIWDAISIGKATLLLPLEVHPANEVITVEFIKDHVVFWDGTNPEAPMITLSGLRGTMADELLVIRSTIDTSSKAYNAIQDPSTRSSALGSLPPLPLTESIIKSSPSPSEPSSPLPLPTSPKPPAESPYPSYNLTSHHPSLPLPPRPHSVSSPIKPPLPPRPRPTPTAAAASAGSRLSTSFASLFGRATPATPPASPQIAATPLQAGPAGATSSPEGSIQSSADGTDHPIGVPAFTISKRIIRKDVARSVLKALHHDIRASLSPSGAPSWVAERLEEFAEREGLLPFVKAKAKNADGSVGGYIMGAGLPENTSMDDVGQRFQEFYSDIEELLVKRRWKGKSGFAGGLHFQNRHTSSGGSISSSTENTDMDEKASIDESAREDDDTEKESEAEDHPEGLRDKRIREVVEAVEKTLCTVFYDRLFLQSCSDDATHDEALSSRIAAVNLLDLNLNHLGVDVGECGPAVETVVKACGETMTQLDAACRTPAEKAAVLVAAHKILVDGLSRLPPIQLKYEDEILDDKTPRAVNFDRPDVDAEDDVASPLDTSTSQGLLHDSPTVVLSPNSAREQGAAVPGTPQEAENPPRAVSPRLTISPAPPSAPTPVSGDIILPLMIFAAVKANPPHLVSHLLYTQRFRNQAIGGEESYCLINLMAVAEFLENVDLAALGLGDSEKHVISTAELSPITVTRPGTEPASPRSVQASLRGRVEQQVDAIAGSANKVLTGVVDTSFGVLRALLPGAQVNESPIADPDLQESAPWNSSRPGFGLLRRDTAFSIASIAASLPGAGIRSKTPVQKDEDGQQLMEVPSRPASIRSARREEESEDEEDEDYEEGDEEGEDDEEEHDTRSIRSFESMMSSRSNRKRRRVPKGRKSITDRLASVPGLSRLSHQQQPSDANRASPPGSRRSSLLVPPINSRYDSPSSSRAASPITIRVSPPNPRFLECTEDDIKVSEVGELLREYRRMVEAVRAMGGFHD
ncbi:hypothetical protein BDY19DRAFT_1075893 [Irpex rosettiformis]|uniref:Uncharacterized protein n=1 Tax=Irpex rosettiformis TaxID=378272 RepID=A0ACB8TUY3_9APHY|nr:hypothetical protein BDY19DRAFT_1075893 [Irpex rosettiformis]